ncbi:hypothetical protein UPYG_G00037970 [Umbra pygmaea]|uniref:Uncharacterized protein n=1 Tax=Umbra pygmaea TaxID=75934 RepID=A0ABD0YDD2_UMBPY
MNRAGGLHLTLLLLGCAHGGDSCQKEMVFSEGIQLFIQGLKPSDPSVLILTSFGSDPDFQEYCWKYSYGTVECLRKGLEDT